MGSAAMMTFGDILELGTDELSTKLLHDILDQDDDTSKTLLVSAESQLENLEKHKDAESQSHQLLYEDEFLGSVRSKVRPLYIIRSQWSLLCEGCL